jgi:hypothetical protein
MKYVAPGCCQCGSLFADFSISAKGLKNFGASFMARMLLENVCLGKPERKGLPRRGASLAPFFKRGLAAPSPWWGQPGPNL